MGLSNSWIAVRGLDRAAALEALQLELGREIPRDELPDLAVGEAPGGWLVLTISGDAIFGARFLDLAKGRTAVACFEEEHVMYAEARGYEDGVETWRVIHNPDEDERHLEVSGTPPPALAELRAKAAREDDEGDGTDFFFEIPPELARSVCGYRFANDGSPEVVFTEILRPRPAAKPGLLARLFGAR